MAVPAVANATLGAVPLVHGPGGDDFVFYRMHADNLQNRSAAEFMAAEMAVAAGRFS